jgi:hypothetical protein
MRKIDVITIGRTVSESDIFVLKQELDFRKYHKEHSPKLT